MKSIILRRKGMVASAVALTSAAVLVVGGIAYADIIQDTVDSSSGITVVAGSTTGVTAQIFINGGVTSGGDTVSGCNVSADAPLVLDIVTPTGVTASPNHLTLTDCTPTKYTVTFTASSTGVSGHATATIVSAPAGYFENNVDIPITVTGGTVTPPVDTTKPTISHSLDPAAPNTNGWYKTDVTVTFTCTDTGSGIQSCTGDTTLGEGADQSVTGMATDVAGNIATDEVDGINIDETAPTVSLSGGPTGTIYYGDTITAPTCNASDLLSGLDGTCSVTGGGTGVGDHSFMATATDLAGNTTTETLNYSVLAWTLSGFYQPVDMSGIWNTVKNGSTVPLKFNVYKGSTELTDTAVVKSFTQTAVTCPNGSAPTDAIEFTTTGGTNLRYDTTAHQFVQNWATPKKAGTCWATTMTTQDGGHISANFMLK